MKKSEFPEGGFVELVDYMGTDATVVNAARVSFGKRITEEEFGDKDVKLLNYLAANAHTAPFRHCTLQFHIKAPEFVARQFYKHIIGSDYSFKDAPVSELSGRYAEVTDEPWLPTELRMQSKDKKQGSSDEKLDPVKEAQYLGLYSNATKLCFDTYKALLDMGVAREVARTILPLNFFTEWYWTASLQAVYHLVELRDSEHAQKEIREYAIAIADLTKELFPFSWEALNASK